MRADLADLPIADVGVEDLLKHRQLLGPDQLFVIQEPAVDDHSVVEHALDLVYDLGSHVHEFHRKTT